MKNQIEFTKEKTTIIKGFAIVFMIILHVFGGSGWYDVDLKMNHNEVLMNFMPTFKICVGMFVFMVGYGYAFSKTKGFAYSVRHINKLLSTFWIILFVFAFPAAVGSIKNGGELINNMLGISSTLCWVSWFVYFYIWAMIVMPFIGRIIDKKPILWTPVLMIVAYGLMAVVHKYVWATSHNDWTQALFDCLLETPLMLLGYTFAKIKIYEKIKVPTKWTIAFTAVLVAVIVLVAKAYISGSLAIFAELIYAPIMIFCILVIFTAKPLKITSKVMMELGDKSVYMWFFHALFFTAATRPTYQHFVLISDNLWVIALWTIILSYVCSALIKKIIEI